MSTFLWQGIMFGPIHSRRLGTSLGVNLLPTGGKVCNFDCIYCECGWNKDKRTTEKIPPFEAVCSVMESGLEQLHSDGTKIDTITFSGNGEPTLHPDFPAIIDFTLKMRDRHYPDAVVSVLSNSTTAHIDSIREALMKVDNPIMKLDSADDAFIALLNRPRPDYSRKKVIEALKLFNGKFILQTMFLKGRIGDTLIDSTAPALAAQWQETVRELKPREVMMYTIDRETPAGNLLKVTVEEMKSIALPIEGAGIKVQIRG